MDARHKPLSVRLTVLLVLLPLHGGAIGWVSNIVASVDERIEMHRVD
jgi:hypothetical protein